MSVIYAVFWTAKSLCQFVTKIAVTDSYISLVVSERRRKRGRSNTIAIGMNDGFANFDDSLQTL